MDTDLHGFFSVIICVICGDIFFVLPQIDTDLHGFFSVIICVICGDIFFVLPLMDTDLHGFFSVTICVIRGAILMYSKIPRQSVDDKMLYAVEFVECHFKPCIKGLKNQISIFLPIIIYYPFF